MLRNYLKEIKEKRTKYNPNKNLYSRISCGRVLNITPERDELKIRRIRDFTIKRTVIGKGNILVIYFLMLRNIWGG